MLQSSSDAAPNKKLPMIAMVCILDKLNGPIMIKNYYVDA